MDSTNALRGLPFSRRLNANPAGGLRHQLQSCNNQTKAPVSGITIVSIMWKMPVTMITSVSILSKMPVTNITMVSIEFSVLVALTVRAHRPAAPYQAGGYRQAQEAVVAVPLCREAERTTLLTKTQLYLNLKTCQETDTQLTRSYQGNL